MKRFEEFIDIYSLSKPDAPTEKYIHVLSQNPNVNADMNHLWRFRHIFIGYVPVFGNVI